MFSIGVTGPLCVNAFWCEEKGLVEIQPVLSLVFLCFCKLETVSHYPCEFLKYLYMW